MKYLNTIQYVPVLEALDLARIRRELSEASYSKELSTVLTEMARRADLPYEEAMNLARQVMEEVRSFEKLQTAVTDNVGETITALLSAMDQLDPLNRLILLDQFHRELGLLAGYRDTPLEMPRQWESEEERHAWISERTEGLKAQILARTDRMVLSPEYMDQIIERISGLSYTVASQADGETVYKLKCVTAMYMTLHDGEPSAEKLTQNVRCVCTATEMEAVGDAVNRGLLTEERAYDLICLLILAALVAAVFFLILNYEYFAVLAKAMGTSGETLNAAIQSLVQEGYSRSVVLQTIKNYTGMTNAFTSVGGLGTILSALGGLAYGAVAAILLWSLLNDAIRTVARSAADYFLELRPAMMDGTDSAALGMTRIRQYATVQVRDAPILQKWDYSEEEEETEASYE